MGHPNTPHNKPKFSKAAWVSEAMQLHDEGWSERAIARRLGLHHSTVNTALNAEFERIRPSEEEVQAFRERKRERLYRGLQKWTQVRDDSIAAAEASPDCIPDYKAGELVLKHEALLAAVEGTDAPKRTEVSGPDGGPMATVDLSRMSDEQLDRVLATLEPDSAEPRAAAGGGSEGEGAEGEQSSTT